MIRVTIEEVIEDDDELTLTRKILGRAEIEGGARSEIVGTVFRALGVISTWEFNYGR